MNELSMILMSLLATEDKTSVNYHIAKYLLENAHLLDNVSINSLAKACNVSSASISRFCKHIGLDDFWNLKVLIHTYYPGKSVSIKYHYENRHEVEAYNFLDELQDCISFLKENLDLHDLEELVMDIKNYQRVIIMGTAQSFGVAITLQNDLIAFGKIAVVCGEPSEQIKYLTNENSDDLIIIFSATGEFFRYTLNQRSLIEKEIHSKVYLITTNKHTNNSYVYKTIQLFNRYNYSSNLLLNVYVALISSYYKKKAS